MSSRVITPRTIAKRAGGDHGIPAQAPPLHEQVQPIALPHHLYPPDRWENLDQSNYVALPAIGAQANVISFQVPIGRNGIVKKIANTFVGGGFQEGQGNIVWQILVDGAPPPGASSYDSILDSLGLVNNPTEISGFRIFENQILTLVIKNVALVQANQFVGGRFVGFLYPRDMEAENLWV